MMLAKPEKNNELFPNLPHFHFSIKIMKDMSFYADIKFTKLVMGLNSDYFI